MSYTLPTGHHSMVYDHTRNAFYSRAIKALTHQSSVIMDLGAGLGLHGFMAARAGAKKVYLVEPEPVIHVAARLAGENGLAEKIECIQARVEELELAQPVDIIISVFTGNFLLQEDLLPALFHARDQHLAENGRLIPDQAKMLVQPVSAEKLFNKNIGHWSESSQGIDLSTVRMHAANSIYYDDFREEEYESLAQPAEILHMDFMTATSADCTASIDIKITADGLCHGFLGWFDMRLGDCWLSTSPTAQKTHWRQVYLPLDPPLELQKNQQIRFSLRRPEFGEWSWVVDTKGTRQNHSTFLSVPLNHSQMAKKTDSYKPVLTKRGRLAKQVLDRFDGNTAKTEIIQAILSCEDKRFHNEPETRRFITRLIDYYG